MLTAAALVVAAAGFASANDIELFQTAAGGALAPVTAPPGVASPDATVTGYSQAVAATAAAAWVTAQCPATWVCNVNSVTFEEVDIGYNINLTQSFTLNNSNSTTVQMPCLAVAGSVCTGNNNPTNVAKGIAIQGTSQLQIDDGILGGYSAGPPVTDPSQGDIINATGLPTDNVATNTATGASCSSIGNGCTYSYALATGDTTFTSAAAYVLSAGLSEYYKISDAQWSSGINESGYYSQATVPFTVYSLLGAITATSQTGVTTVSNNAFLNTGSTISVQYGYVVDYTNYNPGGTPEPGTLMLMGGALVGLGLFGRQRIRKQ